MYDMKDEKTDRRTERDREEKEGVGKGRSRKNHIMYEKAIVRPVILYI